MVAEVPRPGSGTVDVPAQRGSIPPDEQHGLPLQPISHGGIGVIDVAAARSAVGPRKYPAPLPQSSSRAGQATRQSTISPVVTQCSRSADLQPCGQASDIPQWPTSPVEHSQRFPLPPSTLDSAASPGPAGSIPVAAPIERNRIHALDQAPRCFTPHCDARPADAAREQGEVT